MSNTLQGASLKVLIVEDELSFALELEILEMESKLAWQF